MKKISSLSGWKRSEESLWKKGIFGFGITFQTQDIEEINKQINDKKFTFSVKIPENNLLTADLLLGEPYIVFNGFGGPFLPNLYDQVNTEFPPVFFMDINIFGSVKSNNICLTMKDTVTNLFYITTSSSDSSDTSSIFPSMLPVDNNFIIENIEISKFNTQLKFQGQPVFVMGNGSNFSSVLPTNSILFDIGGDDLPVFLVSKDIRDSNRIFIETESELSSEQDQFIQEINNISSPILHMDSTVFTVPASNRTIRSVVIYYKEAGMPKLKFLRTDSGTSSQTVPPSFQMDNISGAIDDVTDVFLLKNGNDTEYQIYLKTNSTCQIFNKNSQNQWVVQSTVSNNNKLLKMNNQVILNQDIDNNLSVFRTFDQFASTVIPYLEKINEFVQPFDTIDKIVSITDETSSAAIPKIAILASKKINKLTTPFLLLFNIDFPDLPVPASVGVWNMETGFIDRAFSSFSIIQSSIVKDSEENYSVVLNTINRSKIHSFNSDNFSFELEYDKNKHNINHNNIWLPGIARSVSDKYGLSPFKYPTINELKTSPYNLKFPDDFNYYSFLGNTYDIGNTSEIKNLNGNIGSKLPENLKFFKNFINNSHIIDYIAYSAITGDALIHPIVINPDNSISMNPLYNFKNKKYGGSDQQYTTVMLMSIGNSKKLDNPFIWFESNAMGLIGIRQEGNIFVSGARTEQLDHFNNQSLWMGIFPDVIKVEDTQEKSFNDLAPPDWNFDKLNSVEMGDYLEDNEL